MSDEPEPMRFYGGPKDGEPVTGASPDFLAARVEVEGHQGFYTYNEITMRYEWTET